MTTPANRLRARLDDLTQRLERFARVPRDAVPDLVDYLRSSLAASAGRAAGGAQAARKRAERTASTILTAAAGLPPTRPLRELRAVVRKRLVRNGAIAPSDTTIRRVLREAIGNNHQFGTDLAILRNSAWQSTASTT